LKRLGKWTRILVLGYSYPVRWSRCPRLSLR
jgi:hypothetical protein